MQNIFDSLKVLICEKLTICLLISFSLGAIISFLYFQRKLNVSDADTIEEFNVSSQDTISVDISGAIIKPGVYKVPKDYRISDLIDLSGGFSPDASFEYISKNINLAIKLEDSKKVYIPFEWDTYYIDNTLVNVSSLVVKDSIQNVPNSSDEDTKSTTNSDTNKQGSNTTKLNVNSATLEQLDSLSGIGLVYAQKIIDNRPYVSIDDMVKKSGLSESTISKFSSQISFE